MTAAEQEGLSIGAAGRSDWRTDIARLFDEQAIPGLDSGALPLLAGRIAEVLKVPLEELPDRRVRDVLARSIEVAVRRIEAPEARPELAAIRAAQAYLLLGQTPSEEQQRRVAAANGKSELGLASKPFRWSWARYIELMLIDGREPELGFQEKAGSRRKDIYKTSLTDAVAVVLSNPIHLRNLPEGQTGSTQRSEGVAKLLADGDAFAQEIRVAHAVYVTRSIEQQLFENIIDPAHSWCHAIVAEAGFGKSTLLVSLADRIRAETRLTVLLLSATWFQSGPDRLTVDRVLRAVEEILESSEQPIVLLDTADLLLHDPGSISVVRDLLGAFVSFGVTSLITTRPREAEVLAHGDIRRVILGPYDDHELIDAVTSHAARYLRPDTQSATVHDVLAATARGLPVEEICRSPLLLRLLFELADGQAPELQEVDVTRLYEDYWERRIIRDARSDTDRAFDIEPTRDLSTPAGTVAVAMLAAGTPELDIATLTDLGGRVQDARGAAGAAALRPAIDTLVQRGALLRNGDRVRFFHQTVFEFAAAKSFARQPGPSAATGLLPRVLGEGGDLFVGAVLEQLLILLGRDPTADKAVRSALSELLTGPEPIQDIALVVWAHHPTLLADQESSLASVHATALARATIVVPTVAGINPADACTKLELLWVHGNDETALAVARAFARLAFRAPDDVARSLARVGLIESLTAEEAMTADEIAAISDLLHTIAPTRPEFARSGLVRLLQACSRADDGAGTLAAQLRRIASAWEIIGDRPFFANLTELIEWQQKPSANLIDATAQILAVEHQTRLDTDSAEGIADWNRYVAATVAPPRGDHSILVAARALSVGYLLSDIANQDVAAATVRQIITGHNSRTAPLITGELLPRLLGGSSLASNELAAQLTTTLSDLGVSETIGGEAKQALSVLSSPEVPGWRLATILPNHLSEKHWSDHPELLRVLPAAAAAGSGPAQRVVRDLPPNVQRLKAADRERLLRAAMTQVSLYPPLIPVIVALDISLERVRDINQIAATKELREYLLSLKTDLLAYVRQLITGPPDQQWSGAQLADALIGRGQITLLGWSELRSYLDTVQQIAARRTLINCIWKLPTTPRTLAQEIRYLQQSIAVTPGATVPVARVTNGPDTDETILDSCRRAWLRLLTLESVPAADDWPTVQTLSLYPAEATMPSLDGRDLALTTQYLEKLAQRGVDAVGQYLLEYMGSLSQVEFTSHEILLWRRELHKAVRSIVPANDEPSLREFIRAAPALAPVIAAQLVEVLAEINYQRARPHLQELLNEKLDADLRNSIVGLLRNRDRSMGTRAFPELFDILASA